MSNVLQNLVPYVPPALVKAILTEPKAPVKPTSEQFLGAVLFADVSGFTPLTEALATKAETEGPEELTQLLNRYFSWMIAFIEREGGEVVQFSGDAITVVFPAIDEPLSNAIRRAMQTAQTLQGAMEDFESVESSAGAISLGMKIGIGCGEIIAMKVGGKRSRWEYVIAGEPLRQVFKAEEQAKRGDIILSPEAKALIYPAPLKPQALIQPDLESVTDIWAVEKALHSFLPTTISQWIEMGLTDWLSVLRTMSVVFVGVGGLDYSQTEAETLLHNFVEQAQETIYRYEGSINKVTVDDKGTVLLILFGAPPNAHEDDAFRSIRCALDLQKLTGSNETDKLPLRLAVGIATGWVFAGPVGSQTRREYTVMGDTVNLAARLMSQAGAGGILCDIETCLQIKGQISFDPLPPVKLKGKSGLIPVFKPIVASLSDSQLSAQQQEQLDSGHTAVMIGRKAERAQLKTALESIKTEAGRTLVIEGEAGIGKSRLAMELRAMAQRRKISLYQGAGQSIEQETPYRAWRDIFSAYFELNQAMSLAQQRQQVTKIISQIAPPQAPYISLLNNILNLDFPDTEQTLALNPAQGQQRLTGLLVSLLIIYAQTKPLVIILEDAHWLDSLSWELATFLSRAASARKSHLLFALFTRPLDETSLGTEALMQLTSRDETEHVSLGTLNFEETITLVSNRLSLPIKGLPKTVANVVYRQAEGNPFYAEELIYALRDQGYIRIVPSKRTPSLNRCIVSGDLEKATNMLPKTVQGVVLSRIDNLPPEEQLALKVAAVIGRSFSVAPLQHALSENTSINNLLLRKQLDNLAQLNLTLQEAAEPGLSYRFKHIITRDVAYQTLLFAQRRQLHRLVAEWYEETYHINSATAASDPNLIDNAFVIPLLVYHYEQAGMTAQAAIYLELAGERAATVNAINEAITYYERAVTLVKSQSGYERLGNLYRQKGASSEAIRSFRRALVLAKQVEDEPGQAQILNGLSWVYWMYDRYQEAYETAKQVLTLTNISNLERAEAESHLGMVSWITGHLAEAEIWCQQSLETRRNSEDDVGLAGVYNRLGLVYFSMGKFSLAANAFNQALKDRRKNDDYWGQAYCLNNLGKVAIEWGEYEQATAFLDSAQTLFEEIESYDGMLVVYTNQGRILLRQGKAEEALPILHNALSQAINLSRPSAYTLADIQLLIAEANLKLKNYLQARAIAVSALERVETAGNNEHVAFSLAILAQIYQLQDDLERADRTYIRAITLFEKVGNPVGLAQAQLAYAHFLNEQGRTAEGAKLEALAHQKAEDLEINL